MNVKEIYATIKSSEMYSRIASGAFWSIFGTAISKFIVLVAGIICANILGPKGYGELGIIRSTISMFVIFGTAGMGVTATKYISQHLKNEVDKVGTIFAISNLFTLVSGLIVSALIIIFSSRVASLLNEPDLSFSIKFGGFILFFSVINGCFQGSMMGVENFKGLAINTFISSVIEAVFVVAGSKVGGVIGALVGYGIGIMSLTVLNRFSVKKFFQSIGLKVNYSSLRLKDFKVLYQFSIPAALSSFIVVPSYWIARAILANRSGFEEVGMYEVAEQWRTIILFIPSALCNIILPMLSGYQSTNDRKSYKKALILNLSLNVSISAIASLVVILATGLIIGAYGDGFDNKLTFIALACSCIFSSFASVVGVSIVSKGKVWYGLGFNILWSIMFIGLSYIFISKGMGSLGISLGCLISYFFHSLFQLIFLVSLLKREKAL